MSEARGNPGPARRRSGLWPLSVGSFVVFMVVWDGVVRLGLINPLFTSSPSRIAVTALRLFVEGGLLRDLSDSAVVLLWGFALAIVIGIPLGLMAGWYRDLDGFLSPYISALYATPRIALLPLIVLWFGLGLTSRILVVFLGAVFPILLSAAAGVKSMDGVHLRVARCFGASDLDIFIEVALPASAPLIVSGIRLGLGRALIGVVVAEFVIAQRGIGAVMANAGAVLDTDTVMVGVFTIIFCGIGLSMLLNQVEKLFSKWRPA